MQIEFHQWDWMPGFAAFLDIDGKMEKSPDTKAFCVLNLGSTLGMVAAGDAKPSELPYFIAESIMHEVIHAIEKWAEVEFSEERVEALIHKYSVARGKLPADAEFEMPESAEQPDDAIDIEEQLQNPTFVHLNMQRGGIAKLTDAQVRDMYPHLFEELEA